MGLEKGDIYLVNRNGASYQISSERLEQEFFVPTFPVFQPEVLSPGHVPGIESDPDYLDDPEGVDVDDAKFISTNFGPEDLSYTFRKWTVEVSAQPYDNRPNYEPYEPVTGSPFIDTSHPDNGNPWPDAPELEEGKFYRVSVQYVAEEGESPVSETNIFKVAQNARALTSEITKVEGDGIITCETELIKSANPQSISQVAWGTNGAEVIDFSSLPDSEVLTFLVITQGTAGAEGCPGRQSGSPVGGYGGGSGGTGAIFYRRMTKKEYVDEFGSTLYTQQISNNFNGTELKAQGAAGRKPWGTSNCGAYPGGATGPNGVEMTGYDFTFLNSLFPDQLEFKAAINSQLDPGGIGGTAEKLAGRGGNLPVFGGPFSGDTGAGGQGGNAGIQIIGTGVFSSVPETPRAANGGRPPNVPGNKSPSYGGYGAYGWGAGGAGGGGGANHSVPIQGGGSYIVNDPGVGADGGPGINLVVVGAENTILSFPSAQGFDCFEPGDVVQDPDVKVISKDDNANTITVDGGKWDVSNQSQVWSSTLYSVGHNFFSSLTKEMAFDGDPTAGAVVNAGAATITFEAETPITITEKFEWYLSAYSNGSATNDSELILDGTTVNIAGLGANQFIEIPEFVGKTISPSTPLLMRNKDDNQRAYFYGVMIDDKLLVDAVNDSQVWSSGTVTGDPIGNVKGTFNGDLTSGGFSNGATDNARSTLTFDTRVDITSDVVMRTNGLFSSPGVAANLGIVTTNGTLFSGDATVTLVDSKNVATWDVATTGAQLLGLSYAKNTSITQIVVDGKILLDTGTDRGLGDNKLVKETPYDTTLTLASSRNFKYFNVGDLVKMGMDVDVPYQPVSDSIVSVGNQRELEYEYKSHSSPASLSSLTWASADSGPETVQSGSQPNTSLPLSYWAFIKFDHPAKINWGPPNSGSNKYVSYFYSNDGVNWTYDSNYNQTPGNFPGPFQDSINSAEYWAMCYSNSGSPITDLNTTSTSSLIPNNWYQYIIPSYTLLTLSGPTDLAYFRVGDVVQGTNVDNEIGTSYIYVGDFNNEPDWSAQSGDGHTTWEIGGSVDDPVSVLIDCKDTTGTVAIWTSNDNVSWIRVDSMGSEYPYDIGTNNAKAYRYMRLASASISYTFTVTAVLSSAVKVISKDDTVPSITVDGGKWDASNQSQVWSSMTGGGTPDRGSFSLWFDNITSVDNAFIPIAGDTITCNLSSDITGVTSIRAYTWYPAGVPSNENGSFRINNAPVTPTSKVQGDWTELPAPSNGILSSFGIYSENNDANGNYVYVSAWEINGKVLVDPVNDSQVWSESLSTPTGNFDGDVSNAFDGDLTTRTRGVESDDEPVAEITFQPSGLSFTNSFEVYVNIDNINANYKTLTLVTDTGTQSITSTSLGAGDAQTNVWAKFENHPGVVTSFSIPRTFGVSNNIFAFKVDGKFLIDSGTDRGLGDTEVTCLSPLKAPTDWTIQGINENNNTFKVSHATPNDNDQAWIANDNQAGTDFYVVGPDLEDVYRSKVGNMTLGGYYYNQGTNSVATGFDLYKTYGKYADYTTIGWKKIIGDPKTFHIDTEDGFVGLNDVSARIQVLQDRLTGFESDLSI